MTSLLLASALFIVLHTGVSGTPIRQSLVSLIGLRAYLTLFALGTIGALWWMTRAYHHAFNEGNVVLWELGPGARHAAGPVMLVAFLLAVPGILTRSPTGVGQGAIVERGPEPRGIHRVTRHPFLWGVMLWAVMHLMANGDQASVVLFTTFLVVAAVGTRSIDEKRARAHGKAWDDYKARSSNVPFLAIAQGRTRFSLKEIGVARIAAALVVYGAVVAIHPWLFGAYPLPGMAD